MTQFDAVSLGIIWDRLISITDEIVLALVRTSFSINVRESYDLACVLFDATGALARAGNLQRAVVHRHRAADARHMLAQFPPESLSRATSS